MDKSKDIFYFEGRRVKFWLLVWILRDRDICPPVDQALRDRQLAYAATVLPEAIARKVKGVENWAFGLGAWAHFRKLPHLEVTLDTFCDMRVGTIMYAGISWSHHVQGFRDSLEQSIGQFMKGKTESKVPVIKITVDRGGRRSFRGSSWARDRTDGPIY